MFETMNPANEKILQRYAFQSEAEVDACIDESACAAEAWAVNDWAVREQCMQRLAVELTTHREPLASQITLEMGKPYTQALAEVDKCIECCQFFAQHVQTWLQPTEIQLNDQTKAIQCFEPVGVIFAIMPWNFPLWQIMRCLVPTLLVGNALLLSPAACTQGTAEQLESLVNSAGFPKGLFQCLRISDAEAHRIIAHPKIEGVTLTGSQKAGAAVAASAGAAIKKTVLELGGSDPYLVLEDADIEHAAQVCVQARLMNAGQVCIAAKRFIVHAKVLKAFMACVQHLSAAYQMGDPMAHTTQLGPLARSDLRAHLHQQVQSSVAQGARCLMGGQLPEGPGFFYPVTLLTDVKLGMPAYHEELFGPVICCLEAQDEQAAIRIANDTCFGLTAAVFSRDTARVMQQIVPALKVGSCGVNQAVHSYFEVPFGGVKRSGYGRELGRLGCYEFLNVKAIFTE